MMFLHSLVILLASYLVSPAYSAPTLIPVTQTNGPVRANGYLIKYKERNVDGIKPHRHIFDQFGPNDASLRHEYRNGIAGTFSPDALKALRSSSEVESIEPDTIGGVDALVTQMDAPWGLQRISQLGKIGSSATGSANYKYTYDSSAGEGVDIYVIDTGINTNHTDFGGRAVWGKTFGGYYPEVDGFGHGTHVAGIAGGTRYGVAKKATLIAVRVLDSNGSGAISDCVAAIEWAIDQAQESGNPSVITISLRYSPSDILDSIVTAAVAAGVHVTASAGNSSVRSSSQSPGRAPDVITVGATDITDSMASYSNFGPGVDIFAPGTSIISDYIGSSNTQTTIMSGTSMATPHVAGLIAYIVGKIGDDTPANILALMKSYSPKGVIAGIPSDTVNELIDNGVPGPPESLPPNDDPFSDSTESTSSTKPISPPTTRTL